MNKSKKKAIPLLSFFSGGGFMDMGFIKAGFEVAWTNEFDPTFAELYGQGVSSWKKSRSSEKNENEEGISNQNSIKEITANQIIKEAFDGKKPAKFGIIGGPPCQDFSINGNLNGFKGEKGTLTDAYLYKVLELQPSFFVMENVTGLIKVKKNARHFFELLKVMEDDYLIDWDVLDSLEFGVPQSRERIFVVGISKKQYEIESANLETKGHWFPFHENAKFVNPKISFKWPQAVQYGSLIVKDANIPYELCLDSCLIKPEEEHAIPNAGEYFNLKGDVARFSLIKEGETNRPSFKRLHRFKYSPTACYGNNEVHLHPYQLRRLSVREALRIQGVEDTYILTTKGMLSKKFKMIGNGVPTPLAEGVAKTLKSFVDKLKVKSSYMPSNIDN